jgi:membrane protease YdiL (CAAX protease family)
MSTTPPEEPEPSEPEPDAGTSGLRDRIDPRLVAVAVALVLGFGGILLSDLLGRLLSRGLSTLGVQLGAIGGILLSLLVVQVLALGGVSVAYLAYRGDFGFVKVGVPSGRDLIWVVVGWVLMYVGVIAVGLAASAAGVTPAPNRVAEIGAQNPTVFLVLIPASILIIGPFEELLYRGVIQERLTETFNQYAAIGLASLVFGLAHATSFAGPASGLAVSLGAIAVIAVVPAVSYQQTRNLVVPSLIHGLFNATQFALNYVIFRFFPEAASRATGGTAAVLELLALSV